MTKNRGGGAKQAEWDRMADKVRGLFEAAAAHHVPRRGAPADGSSCETERPPAALAAWRAVISEVESLPRDVREDPWTRKVEADARYNVACMLALTGDKDGALASLSASAGLGFSDLSLLEKDEDLASLRGEPGWARVLDDVKVASGPLTIEKVIRDSIRQGTLTEAGIDASVGPEARSCVVYHHEWIRSPELKGISCLMLASLPDGSGGTSLVHDLEGRTLVPSGKLDGRKFDFRDV